MVEQFIMHDTLEEKVLEGKIWVKFEVYWVLVEYGKSTGRCPGSSKIYKFDNLVQT